MGIKMLRNPFWETFRNDFIVQYTKQMKTILHVLLCCLISGTCSAQLFNHDELVIDSLMSREEFTEAAPLASVYYDRVFANTNSVLFNKANATRMLGVCEKKLGHPIEARKLLQGFVEENTTAGMGGHPDLASVIDEWGNLEAEQRNFDLAESLLNSALRISDSTGLVPTVFHGTILGHLGRLYLLKKDLEKSEPAYLYAINYMEKEGLVNKVIYVYACSGTSMVYNTFPLNDQPKRIKYVEQALAYARKYDYPQVKLLLICADIADQSNDLKTAEKRYLELKGLMDKKKYKSEDYGILHFRLARIYTLMGYLDKSTDCYKTAYDFFTNANLVKTPILHIALAYAQLLTYKGQYEEAEKVLKSAMPYDNVLGKIDLDYQLIEIIEYKDGLVKAGPYYEALLQKMDSISYPDEKNNRLSVSIKIASYFNEIGKYQESKQQYELVSSLIDKVPDPEIIETFKFVVINSKMEDKFNNGNFEESFNNYRLCLKEIRNKNINYLSVFSSADRLKYFQGNKEINDYFFRARYVSDRFLLLDEIVDAHINTKGLLLDFDRVNRRALSENPEKSIQEKYHSWLELRETYFKLIKSYGKEAVENDNESIQLKSKIDQIERDLLNNSVQFSNLRNEKSITSAQIRSALPVQSAAVDFFRFEKNKFNPNKINRPDTILYAALILRPDWSKTELVFFENGNEMEAILFEQYLQQSSNTTPNATILNQLYKAFWQPLESYLQGVKTVCFSPDGVFQKINPEIIQYPDGRYLADVFHIERVNYLGDILQRKSSETDLSSVKTAALFGNPDFSGNRISPAPTSNLEETNRSLLDHIETERGLKLEPLPGSEKEVKSIATMLQENGFSTQVSVREDATEQRLKSLKSPTILHIATHGFYLENARKSKQTTGFSEDAIVENPLLRSMLFLSGAQKTLDGIISSDAADDGILTGEEAQDLHLENCELVVLSACNSGLGKIESGEGVFGLQRAFQVAGAKTIIVSLWQVEDRVTQLLMTTFYQNWLGGMSKHDAFSKAQKVVREKYPAAFYWGAFVMIGG